MSERLDETLFQRFAREARLRAPNPFRADDDGWMAWCRKVWAAFPPWGYDEAFLAEAAREHLPVLLVELGAVKPIGRIDPLWREVAGNRFPSLWAVPLHPDGRWMVFLLEGPGRDLLVLDELSHEWRCPSLRRRGPGLVSLAAWRWHLSPAKAAFRLARLMGLSGPRP